MKVITRISHFTTFLNYTCWIWYFAKLISEILLWWRVREFYNIKVKVIGNLENNQNISKKYYGKSSLDVALATLSWLLLQPRSTLFEELGVVFYCLIVAWFIFDSRIFYWCFAVSLAELYETIADIFIFAKLLNQHFVEIFHSL